MLSSHIQPTAGSRRVRENGETAEHAATLQRGANINNASDNKWKNCHVRGEGEVAVCLTCWRGYHCDQGDIERKKSAHRCTELFDNSSKETRKPIMFVCLHRVVCKTCKGTVVPPATEDRNSENEDLCLAPISAQLALCPRPDCNMARKGVWTCSSAGCHRQNLPDAVFCSGCGKNSTDSDDHHKKELERIMVRATSEQKLVSDVVRSLKRNETMNECNIAVNSGAGTGKTTTAKFLAVMSVEHLHLPLFYLAYNKATQREMEEYSLVTGTRAIVSRTIDALALQIATADLSGLPAAPGAASTTGGASQWTSVTEAQHELQLYQWFQSRHQATWDSLVAGLTARRTTHGRAPTFRVAKDSDAQAEPERAVCQPLRVIFEIIKFFCKSKHVVDNKDNDDEQQEQQQTMSHIRWKCKVRENSYGICGVCGKSKELFTLARATFRRYQNGDMKPTDALRFPLYEKCAQLRMNDNSEAVMRALRRSCKKQFFAANMPMALDEAQDANDCNMDLVIRLARANNSALFVIGDPMQSIYAFRGANVQCFQRISSDPATLHYQLTRSFRFGPQIAEAANTVSWAKENSPRHDIHQHGPIMRLRGKPTEHDDDEDDDDECPRVVPSGRHVFPLAAVSSRRRTVLAWRNVTLVETAINLLLPRYGAAEPGRRPRTSRAVPRIVMSKLGEILHKLRTVVAFALDGLSSSSSSSGPSWKHGNTDLADLRKTFDTFDAFVAAVDAQRDDEHLDDDDGDGLVCVNNDLDMVLLIEKYGALARLINSKMQQVRCREGTTRTQDGEQQEEEEEEEEQQQQQQAEQRPGAEALLKQRYLHKILESFESIKAPEKTKGEDYDFWLSTAHQAKGLEWHTVALADDFVSLAPVAHHLRRRSTNNDDGGGYAYDGDYQWVLKGPKDAVHILYVAMTRAKFLLVLPPELHFWSQFLQTHPKFFAPPPAAQQRQPAAAAAAAAGADEDSSSLANRNFVDLVSAAESAEHSIAAETIRSSASTDVIDVDRFSQVDAMVIDSLEASLAEPPSASQQQRTSSSSSYQYYQNSQSSNSSSQQYRHPRRDRKPCSCSNGVVNRPISIKKTLFMSIKPDPDYLATATQADAAATSGTSAVVKIEAPSIKQEAIARYTEREFGNKPGDNVRWWQIINLVNNVVLFAADNTREAIRYATRVTPAWRPLLIQRACYTNWVDDKFPASAVAAAAAAADDDGVEENTLESAWRRLNAGLSCHEDSCRTCAMGVPCRRTAFGEDVKRSETAMRSMREVVLNRAQSLKRRRDEAGAALCNETVRTDVVDRLYELHDAFHREYVREEKKDPEHNFGGMGFAFGTPFF